ncbi:MAG TPA: hypothetical protein VJX67_05280 [Blastocatellia bacterium]|nr:hypothetical protein [Blastocatellia bacterium]
MSSNKGVSKVVRGVVRGAVNDFEDVRRAGHEVIEVTAAAQGESNTRPSRVVSQTSPLGAVGLRSPRSS